MSTDVSQTPHDTSELKDEKRELEEEVERLKDRCDSLKEQEQETRQEVQEIHDGLSSGDIDAPPDELSDLKAERDSLKEARMAVEENIQQAERRLSEIKGKLQSQDKVDALQEAVARCKKHRDGYEEAIEAAVEAATEQLEEAFGHLCGWREAQEQFKAQARRIFPSLGGGGRGDERTQKIRRALQALSSAGVDYGVALTSAPHYHAGRTHRATFDQYVRSEADAHGEDLPVEGPIAERLYDRLEELEEQRR